MEKKLTRAEELALKSYPISTSYLSESNGDGDRNYPRRLAFIEGYNQAEKDLSLTWEDMAKIDAIILDVNNEFAVDYSKEINRQKFYEEVLKRFEEIKK